MAIFITEARVGIRFEEHGGGVDVAIENGKQKRCIAIFIAAIYILAPVEECTHHFRFTVEGCILKGAPHFATAQQDSERRRQRVAQKACSCTPEQTPTIRMWTINGSSRQQQKM
jgi:hypothetical protein